MCHTFILTSVFINTLFHRYARNIQRISLCRLGPGVIKASRNSVTMPQIFMNSVSKDMQEVLQEDISGGRHFFLRHRLVFFFKEVLI